jgi:uncharacterized phage protein (TIGR02218 family)
MAKTLPAALQAHYDSGSTCMAAAILIQRADGELFGLSSASKKLVLDVTPWDGAPWDLAGETAFEFNNAKGLDLSQVVGTAGFEVDNGEFTVLNDGDLLSEDDVLAGRWYGAQYRMFLWRWDVDAPTIADDIETLKVGTIGEGRVEGATLVMELRCLKQLLQQPIGRVTQPTCPLRFGSQGLGMCNKDPAPFTHSLTVTGVTSKGEFTCSGAGQASDYFGNGDGHWDTGLNHDLHFQVSTFASGVFKLVKPMIFNIQIGDTLTVTAGCRKRPEDCTGKFGNKDNYGGQDHMPTRDRVVSGIGG